MENMGNVENNVESIEFYNRHFITIDEEGRITDGWSDGPRSEKDTINAICINEKGSYQFRLYPEGEENPSLFTLEGIPLYKWENNEVKNRTEKEISNDISGIPDPPPSEMEQLRADVDFLSVMMDVSL